ncbi:hypothetical protein CULT_970016 [[Clostridium] ultunense Esp]|nr:hypothetical protein CULT_970016 [[Clostridium] ultunense Esp]
MFIVLKFMKSIYYSKYLKFIIITNKTNSTYRDILYYKEMYIILKLLNFFNISQYIFLLY